MNSILINQDKCKSILSSKFTIEKVNLGNIKIKEFENKKCFLIKYILLSLILIYFFLKGSLEDNKHRNIFKKMKFPSKSKSFKRAKNFIDKCFKGIYINKRPFKKYINPEVSALIPVYNSNNTISRAIKSIQNQDFLNIEIILINDFSTDDTLSVIEKIQQEDPRIKIIKNKKNMGTLFSRSIGALSANGKYIFSLDNDDMFLDSDVFSTITKIADKGNFDIIEFKALHAEDGFTDIFKTRISTMNFYNPNDNEVLFQPQLGDYPITFGKELGSLRIRTVFLWTKCIRTKVYQNSINRIGKKRYSRFMTNYEDLIATSAIFNEASSYKFISKYGILYLPREGSASKKGNNEIEKVRCDLYWTDVAINVTIKKEENQILIVHFLINLIEKEYLELTLNQSIYDKKLFTSCLERFFNSTIISEFFSFYIFYIFFQLISFIYH